MNCDDFLKRYPDGGLDAIEEVLAQPFDRDLYFAALFVLSAEHPLRIKEGERLLALIPDNEKNGDFPALLNYFRHRTTRDNPFPYSVDWETRWDRPHFDFGPYDRWCVGEVEEVDRDALSVCLMERNSMEWVTIPRDRLPDAVEGETFEIAFLGDEMDVRKFVLVVDPVVQKYAALTKEATDGHKQKMLEWWTEQIKRGSHGHT